MTRAPDYPPVDPRRVSELRQALLRDIAALAPDWRGAQDTQGADRAIVEVAARLGEEATRRLDETPQRDALAFLEMFDIAPPGPVAAQGVSVFALKEDKTAPVLARARTGIEIETLAGESQNFETLEDLRIQPARIDRLATVDPATDRLELAPTQVTSLEPDLTPRPVYRLAASAGPEATVISIEPPVGILPDDLLRVTVGDADPVFLEVAEFSEDGLTTLKAPVGGTGLSVDDVTAIERMVWLDAFAMPNRQEHGLYVGDADILNVKEPAEITLRFEPGSIADILSPNAVEVEIWGTREGPGEPEEAPRWHRLVRLAGPGSDLRLYKSWIGPVDELELGEKKSRWIRIRPQHPIAPENGAHPLTAEAAELEHVTLGIETEEPEDASNDTVSQAAYNSTPLPVTSAFLPFGAEPRRFDTFALAAPEVFTKPKAVATLKFDLVDATLAALTMALRTDTERHAYGIGLNGRLQVLDLTEGRQLWREVGGPPEEVGSTEILPLEPEAGIAAYGLSKLPAAIGTEVVVYANDVVIARVSDGELVAANVQIRRGGSISLGNAVTVASWNQLPALPEGALQDAEHPALVAVPVLGPNHFSFDGFIVSAASGGLHWLKIGPDAHATTTSWAKIITSMDPPTLSPNPVLAFVDGSVDRTENPQDQEAAFLAMDDSGAVWVLRTELDGENPRWDALHDGASDTIRLAPGARPAGLRMEREGDNRLLVAGLSAETSHLQLWEFTIADDGFTLQGDSDSALEIHAGAELRLVRGLSEGDDTLPHVLGYQSPPGAGLAFEWAPQTGQVARHILSEDVALSGPLSHVSAGIFPPDDQHDQALIAFGADDQTLVRLPINPSVSVKEAADSIIAEQASPPDADDPDADDYDLILLERVLQGATERAIEEVMAFDQTASGADVIKLDMGETDWSEPVRVLRAKSGTLGLTFDTTSEDDGRLTGDDAGTIETGQSLLIRPENDTSRHGIFTVESKSADDELIVTEKDELRDLMAGDDGAVCQQIQTVAETAARTASAAQGTLVRIGPLPLAEDPAGLGLFAQPGRIAAAEVLGALPNERTVLVGGWDGPSPNIGDLVKFVGASIVAEVPQLQVLSSNFSAPELSWEYFNGDGWKLLDKNFRDTTADFSRSGEVSFIVPSDLAQTEIGGQEDYWIRARLVGGDYGKPVYKVVTTEVGTDSSEQKVVVDTSELRPPEVARVTAWFKLPPEHAPAQVVARNNLRDLDQTSANRLSGARFAMFEGAMAEPLGTGGGRAILMGTTRSLEPGPASLFVQVREQDRTAKLILETLGPKNAWVPAPLTGEDTTKGLHRTGLLRFNVGERSAQVLLFGKTLHWLRMRVEDLGDWAPALTGTWLNGVSIVQAETIRQELLTSSAGEPNLELTLLKPPVLPDSLELRVRERLSDQEAADLSASGGKGEPAPVVDEVPNLPGEWVLWRQVDSLLDQPADARVYLLSSDGRLRFGDDQNGRIVPAGRDNIRAFSYQSGGERVETAGFAKAALQGSVEGVEMVLAPAPIAGGTHPPSPSELVARMPQVLRHAGQGLSLTDLEALARDNDSEIAQVRAFAPNAPAGRVRLIVLARGANRTPEYSLAQRDNLRRVLHARMSDAYGPACLEVVSAAFVPVTVKVTLVARPGALAALETDARARLETFLHAALGGPDGTGWPPGRSLWPTDVRRALLQLETLDRVVDVEIVMPNGRGLGDVLPNEVITTASTSDLTVLVEGEALA
ncbi:MAG: hypothetical protein LJE61_14150 [Thiocapsa sp.]|nr:hypothetical protein [Thiocapsa sp.]MCG6986330.1 hypothetical protein [Thiocapsa sp.]